MKRLPPARRRNRKLAPFDHGVHIAPDEDSPSFCGAEFDNTTIHKSNVVTFCGRCVNAWEDENRKTAQTWVELVEQLESRLTAINDLSDPRVPHDVNGGAR